MLSSDVSQPTAITTYSSVSAIPLTGEIESPNSPAEFEPLETQEPHTPVCSTRWFTQIFRGSPQRTGGTVLYQANDIPPLHLCILLGFQHYLTMFGGTLSQPYVIACMGTKHCFKINTQLH